MPPLTRLRYTCATCGKLYMGRIEAHYRKFPDHCRKLPPSPTDPKQSYSTIKTLSDAKGAEGGEGSEIHKSVLSPTPGTPASETSGEPGLPMETLTALPHHQQEAHQAPEDLLDVKLEAEDPLQMTAKARRGRGRRKGRARRGRRGRPAKVSSTSAAAVAPPPANPTKVLEKILSAYTSQDIQTAVGQRLFENLSPWQQLCLRVDREGGWPQWQERLRLLEDLLKECQEELFSQTEPLPRPTIAQQEEEGGKLCEGGGEGVPGNGASQTPSASDSQDVPRGEDVVAKGDSSSSSFPASSSSSSSTAMAVKQEENGNFEVSDYIASIFGVRSCEYQLRQRPSSPPSPVVQESPVPGVGSYLCPMGSSPSLVSFGKRSLEDEGSDDTESPPKKRETEAEEVVHQQTVSGIPLEADMVAGAGVMSSKKGQFGSSLDCVSSALEAAACDLELPPYSLSGQLAPVSSASLVTVQSAPSMLAGTPQPITQLPIAQLSVAPLPVTLPHLSECVAASSSSTTLTTAHPAPCSTPTSSLSMEIPSFSTHSTSPPTLVPCLPLTSMDTSFIPTTMSQVSMQQMPLGDMDITAEDLPRLLREGTELVVGCSGDGCDAPKLLDTSGDTTDLSEMLFKLQEATASISQGQENTLGPHLYQEGVSGNNPQLMTPESLHTPGVSLTAQDYGTVVGGTLNPHTNLTLKLDASQGRGEHSMPLLTFSGALNSEFHSDSTLGPSVSRGEDGSKISAILSGVGSQQNGAGKEQEGDRLSIGFGTSNLAMSEFEDLLKR
ncbi:hypothetical protein E2C01_018392 [Portunus trituberculatus]|uniref:Uncharacterized protein n=1 Tax=Portunus trituberculatus TaxID=210409 RepID=A0A5B7DWC1_PORTR|nr:hypothetical protein [Portunus trituberculatus]